MNKRKKQPAIQTMTDTLKASIVQSGIPIRQLAAEIGIERTSLIRFMNDQRSLRLDKADAVARHFGLELMPKSEGKK